MLHFQKTFIFPMDFNDFIILWGHLEATLGNFWVTLGLLWRYDACMWGLGGVVFDLVLAR